MLKQRKQQHQYRPVPLDGAPSSPQEMDRDLDELEQITDATLPKVNYKYMCWVFCTNTTRFQLEVEKWGQHMVKEDADRQYYKMREIIDMQIDFIRDMASGELYEQV